MYLIATNTTRMTQYQFNMGTQAVTGALTWNANSTLKQLTITDPINTANAQDCNYLYDDITRLISANCGFAWSQTFGFDPFGNLTVSVKRGASGECRLSCLRGFSSADAGDIVVSMKFHKIWVQQCRATRRIKKQFGVKSALDYLLGEKLLNFGDSGEGNRDSGLIVISIPDRGDQSSERSDAGRRILQKVITIVKEKVWSPP